MGSSTAWLTRGLFCRRSTTNRVTEANSNVHEVLNPIDVLNKPDAIIPKYLHGEYTGLAKLFNVAAVRRFTAFPLKVFKLNSKRIAIVSHDWAKFKVQSIGWEDLLWSENFKGKTQHIDVGTSSTSLFTFDMIVCPYTDVMYEALGTFLLFPPHPPPPPPHANGCGVNAIGTWTNLIKFWLILQHIGRPIECVNARF